MAAITRIQPLALIDKAIGSRIWVIMKVRHWSEHVCAQDRPCTHFRGPWQTTPPRARLVQQTQRLTLLPLSFPLPCGRLFRQGDKEVVGTLRGFDEYVNMVLDDVTEIEITPTGKKEVRGGKAPEGFYHVTSREGGDASSLSLGCCFHRLLLLPHPATPRLHATAIVVPPPPADAAGPDPSQRSQHMFTCTRYAFS
jgi:hypothetical protein